MKINIGEVDGRSWEEYCQRLLKLKYDQEGYQEVPARYGGDLGIEGFTQTGIAFQCYCPDGDITEKELFEHQRRKITDDINKFLRNSSELTKIFGPLKIKEWQFLTPRYENKELLSHCQKKIDEVKSYGKTYVDPDFKILIKDEDFFSKEAAILIPGRYQIAPSTEEVDKKRILDWTKNNIEYYETIDRKLSRFISDPIRRSKLAEIYIKSFIKGQDIFEKIRRSYPELFEKILHIKSSEELRIEKISILMNQDSIELLKKTLAEYEESLFKSFGESIFLGTIKDLSQEAVSDWLIRCPLDF